MKKKLKLKAEKIHRTKKNQEFYLGQLFILIKTLLQIMFR